MSYWNAGWSATCPPYRSAIERMSHVKLCRDPGGKKMVRSSVGELIDWMYETTDDYVMATSMSKYLVSQGELMFGEDGFEPNSTPDKLSE